MATITAGAKAFKAGSWQLVAVVAATVVVLWVAHVYSHGLGESLHRGRRLDAPEILAIARRELSIVLASVAPLLALLLGAFHVLSASNALWLALGVGVAALAVQGVRYAQLERLGPGGTAVSVGVNVLLGLAIVGLKALVTH